MSKKQKKDTKKVFENKYDPATLRKLIAEGKTADEIQKEFGLVSKQSLRQHVLKLITEDRTFYEVPGLYVRNQKRPMINFKGELRISKKMLAFPDSTYQHHDQFDIEADNEKIVLYRVTSAKEEALPDQPFETLE